MQGRFCRARRKEKFMNTRYGTVIQWSGEDQVYVVTLPEFPLARTHGATYEEALQNGQEVLGILVEMYRTEREPIPLPSVFAYA